MGGPWKKRGPEKLVPGAEDLCVVAKEVCVVVVVVVVFVVVFIAVFVKVFAVVSAVLLVAVFVVIFVIVAGEEHRRTRKRRTGAPRT